MSLELSLATFAEHDWLALVTLWWKGELYHVAYLVPRLIFVYCV